MRRAPAIQAWALVLLASPVAAEESAGPRDARPVISTEARAGYLLLGSERPTGGLTLGGAARYLHPFGERWGGYAGLGAAVVSPNDGWHWMGALASPEVGVWRAAGPWHLSAGLDLSAGQLPTCTPWGLCLRSWGLFPGAAARVALRGESFRIGLELGGMYVTTLPWSGVGMQARIVGAYR
jgi:hypothetical protein